MHTEKWMVYLLVFLGICLKNIFKVNEINHNSLTNTEFPVSALNPTRILALWLVPIEHRDFSWKLRI